MRAAAPRGPVSTCASPPVPRWPWWAIPDRAKARWSTCCRACSTPPLARGCWMASTCGGRAPRGWGAAEMAGLADEMEGVPVGYDTLVAERGIPLSGGQKQRTAIARALLREPRILILDDALSAVDTLTEERILTHLAGVMRGRTVILISHRVSTVRQADATVVLERGKIVERGTHDELVEAGGYYAELSQKQMLEEELEAI